MGCAALPWVRQVEGGSGLKEVPTGWATSEKYRESIPGRDKEPEYKGNYGLNPIL